MQGEGFFKRVRRLTRKGINVGRFMSTLYLLKRELFKLTARLAKWGQKVSSAFRVPRLAHNKSPRENEILKMVTPDVERLWNSPSEGGPHPMEDRRVGHQGHL
jgi:hypothetical protein